jgi:ribonuclease T1
MRLQRKRITLAGALLTVLAVGVCLAGCSQAPSGAEPTEADLSHHKKTHAHQPPAGDAAAHTPHEEGPKPARSGESTGEVAEKAKTVLKHIDEHREAPKGYEGGRVFHNAGSPEEQVLPKHDGSGRAVTYQEWDVNPKVEGVNRGTERLITGSDGSAYVTADHYKTFTKIR